MSKKSLQHYFEKAKGIPLVTSYESVEALVRLKGVSTAPPKKWWWNLNTLIIMTTLSSLALLTGIYLFMPTESAKYQSKSIKPYSIQTDDEELIMPNFTLASEDKAALVEQKENANTSATQLVNYDPLWKEADQAIPMEEMLVEYAEIELEKNSKEFYLERAPLRSFQADSAEKQEAAFEGVKKNIRTSTSSNGVKKFILRNTKGDIRIHAWDQEQIEIRTEVKIKTKKKENEAIALEDFDLALVKDGSVVKVESNWEDVSSCLCSGNSKKNQIKTQDGDKFRVKELNLVYDVYLPNSIALELSNSYADISMPDWEADLKVRVFHAELKGGKVNNLEVSNSYGKVELTNFNEAHGKLFQGEMTLGSGQSIDLSANYSTLDIQQVKKAELKSFQSNAKFNQVADHLISSFRYGKLEIEKPLAVGSIKAFQAKIFAQDIKDLKINFSYSELEAKQVEQLKIENAFQSNISLTEVGAVSGSLKYTPFEVSSLKERMELSTFQSKVKVEELQPDFSQMKLNAKYTELDFKLAANSSYQMNLVSNYADLDLPDFNQTKTVLNNSRYNLSTEHNPQSNGEFRSQIDLNLFQGSLKLSE